MAKYGKGVIVGNAVVLAIALIAAAFSWWLNERVEILPGGIPLPPRSNIVKRDTPDNKRFEIHNYTCNAPRKATYILDFYSRFYSERKWNIEEKEKNIYLFTHDTELLRLVLHPQTYKTVFTIHHRLPR